LNLLSFFSVLIASTHFLLGEGMRKTSLFALFIILLFGNLNASTNFNSRLSSIRIGDDTTMQLSSNIVVDEGKIRIDNGGDITSPGGYLADFSQGILEHYDFETFFTGYLSPNEATHDVRLATDGDIVRAEPGTVLDGIQLEAGISATILGQPIMDDTVLLNDGAEVHLGLQSKLNTTVSMDATDGAWVSGNAWTTVALEDDLMLKDHVILDHKGTVSFDGHRIRTGGVDLTWSGSDQVWYEAADFDLGGDLTLGSTIVFDGVSTATAYFYGNGHTLHMNDNCLFISRDTTLVFENIIIDGLHGKASGGASSAGAIALDEGAYVRFKNVKILMDTSSPYEFDRGTLHVVTGGYLKILPGGGTAQNFEYSTNATELLIESSAKLIIGRGATFEYDSSTATEISFVDDSSEIYIENGTFKSTQDWTFETGTLVVDGKSTLDTTGETTIAIDATADIIIMPAATMLLSGDGTLQYGNEAEAEEEDGDLTETSKFIDTSGAASNNLGSAAAISGNYAIVGSPGANSSQGKATIFFRNGGTWEFQQDVTASDGSSSDLFGFSVAVDGDYAIVGAYRDASETGAAYIFQRSGSTWSEIKKVTASDGASGDRFGYSVAISGDYALVGAYWEDPSGTSNAGSAYIFDRTYGLGVGWWQRAKLTASDKGADDYFGHSVAISGDYAVVGAYSDNYSGDNKGSAYVFERSGITWPEKRKIRPQVAPTYGDYFGWSVSISGDYIICGCPYDDDGGMSSGSAYIFERDGGGEWGNYYAVGGYSYETQKIVSSDDANFDFFGYAVAISGDKAVVGAYGDGDNGVQSGSAYLFERSAGTWTETSKMLASDGAASDFFGKFVGLSGNYAAVGAPGDDNAKGIDAGGAYIFEFS
jgi:hypothetical protein